MANFFLQIRIYVVTFLYSILWMLMFAFSFGESTVVRWLQHSNWVVLMVCIILNVIFSLVIWICLPPTKKKTYGEIFSYLNYGLKL